MGGASGGSRKVSIAGSGEPHPENSVSDWPIFPLLDMNELRINGDLTGYTRGTTRKDLLRLARTFLIAMFVGIVVAGVYFAIAPLTTG